MRKNIAVTLLFLSILACNFNPRGEPATPTSSPPTASPIPVVVTVTPTLTLIATVTAPPAITFTPTRPAQVSVIYREDFSNKASNWVTGSNEAASSDYLNGEYSLKMKRANWQTWSIAPDNKIHSNVYVEVTAKEVSADKEAYPSFGLICNFKDNSNFVFASITKSGYYIIAQKSNGEFKILSDLNNKWILSKDIGINSPSYRLGADCTPNAITFYVDGKRINTVSGTSFTGGGVGVIVENYDKTNVEVRFDDFAITQLK